MADLERLAERIQQMTPSDQLRMAAELIERVKSGECGQGMLGIASAVVDRINLELKSVLLHAHGRKVGRRG